MTTEFAIQTHQVSRTFQTYQKPQGLINSVKGFWNRKYTQNVALAPTTLNLESGQIIGLVGANGAGKTTLLKILSGLVMPSSGSARVLGYDPWKREAAYLRQMSLLLGQKNQLWWDIAPSESFYLLSKIYDLDMAQAKKRVADLAALLRCDHVLNVQLRRLSLGERMKMELIGSLLHQPRILFLDEPTIGLDVLAQTIIREFLSEYVKTHKPTIVLTSHYMDDISRLADTLLLISKGQIVYQGTVDQFVAKSVLSQKVTYRYQNDKNEYCEEVAADKIGDFIHQVTEKGHLQDIRVEEANFEDIIRRFLQT